MRHFIVNIDNVEKDKLVLGAKESGHAIRVLRMKKGQSFIAIDNAGRKYLSRISNISNGRIEADIIEEKKAISRSDLFITAAIALCKGSANEYALQKSTEIQGTGVFNFNFYPSIIKNKDFMLLMKP